MKSKVRIERAIEIQPNIVNLPVKMGSHLFQGSKICKEKRCQKNGDVTGIMFQICDDGRRLENLGCVPARYCTGHWRPGQNDRASFITPDAMVNSKSI
jgi:hypothetical protein